MNPLKRQIIDSILDCQDIPLLTTIYRMLTSEGQPTEVRKLNDPFSDIQNEKNRHSEQDLKDLQRDIDDVFGS